MASVFKRKSDKSLKGTSWYYSYVDENGVRRTRKGFTDRSKTKALADHKESEARLRREGCIDPKADRRLQAEQSPIASHLADYEKSLQNKGNTVKHVSQTREYAGKIIEFANVKWISDLAPSAVQNAIARIKGQGASLRTCNAYLQAIKGFSRWLWRDGRTQDNALAHMQGFNAATDRKRQRRAFSEAELARLIEATANGTTVLRVSGSDRALLYRLAAGTGFRADELRSLAPESFHLDGDPPTVTVAAAYSKRRRDDVQPIRSDLADALRSWLIDKPSGQPAFHVPEKTAKMLRHDLAAAGIPFCDTLGRVLDFHALRHTYITMIVQGGASVKVAQELARHSTPTLTIGRYAHAELQDRQAALSALPDLTGASSSSMTPAGDSLDPVTSDSHQRRRRRSTLATQRVVMRRCLARSTLPARSRTRTVSRWIPSRKTPSVGN